MISLIQGIEALLSHFPVEGRNYEPPCSDQGSHMLVEV